MLSSIHKQSIEKRCVSCHNKSQPLPLRQIIEEFSSSLCPSLSYSSLICICSLTKGGQFLGTTRLGLHTQRSSSKSVNATVKVRTEMWPASRMPVFCQGMPPTAGVAVRAGHSGSPFSFTSAVTPKMFKLHLLLSWHFLSSERPPVHGEQHRRAEGFWGSH